MPASNFLEAYQYLTMDLWVVYSRLTTFLIKGGHNVTVAYGPASCGGTVSANVAPDRQSLYVSENYFSFGLYLLM